MQSDGIVAMLDVSIAVIERAHQQHGDSLFRTVSAIRGATTASRRLGKPDLAAELLLVPPSAEGKQLPTSISTTVEVASMLYVPSMSTIVECRVCADAHRLPAVRIWSSPFAYC
jgi:hypothetical protein